MLFMLLRTKKKNIDGKEVESKSPAAIDLGLMNYLVMVMYPRFRRPNERRVKKSSREKWTRSDKYRSCWLKFSNKSYHVV
jgi:hypothetical protein